MDRVFHHPRLTLAIMAVVVLGVGHRALFIVQDNSPDTLFAVDPAAKATYHRMVRTFGGDEVVLVQLLGARPDDPAHLQAVARLDRRLAAAPGVRQVLSPARIYLPDLAPGADAARAPRPPTRAELADVAAELAALPLYRKIGVHDPREPALGALAVVVMEGPTARSRLAAALDRIRAEARREGFRVRVAGLTPAHAAVDRELKRSLTIFMPLVAAVALIIAFVLFRSFKALVAMLLPVIGALLLGVAGMELAGQPLNLVSAVMPPLVLAVGLAGAVHLISHYASLLEQEGLVPVEAVKRTVRDKLAPTAFAYGTTALGFGSLALSEMHAVKVMGLASAGAILAAMVLVTVGTPTLVLLLRPRVAMPIHRRVLLERLARFAIVRRLGILVTAAVLTGVLAWGATRTETSSNGMNFLPVDAPERVDYQALERSGLGLGNLDVWVHVPVPRERLLHAAGKLADMADALADVPGVTGSVGVHDLLRILSFRMARFLGRTPAGRPPLPSSLAPLDALDPAGRAAVEALLARYWHPGAGLKLTLLAVTGDPGALSEQTRRIRLAAHAAFPGARVDVSGHYALLIATPGAVTQTLASSLAVTVGLIGLIFLVAFRSLGLTLAALFVNLFPVLAVFGLMGLVGLPVDVATVMIGSVLFGIAVDDSFHYLHHRRREGGLLPAARIAGQGIVGTSLILAGGFAVLSLSGFRPVVHLGVLLAGGTMLALLLDAVVLPALIGRRSDLDG